MCKSNMKRTMAVGCTIAVLVLSVYITTVTCATTGTWQSAKVNRHNFNPDSKIIGDEKEIQVLNFPSASKSHIANIMTNSLIAITTKKKIWDDELERYAKKIAIYNQIRGSKSRVINEYADGLEVIFNYTDKKYQNSRNFNHGTALLNFEVNNFIDQIFEWGKSTGETSQRILRDSTVSKVGCAAAGWQGSVISVCAFNKPGKDQIDEQTDVNFLTLQNFAKSVDVIKADKNKLLELSKSPETADLKLDRKDVCMDIKKVFEKISTDRNKKQIATACSEYWPQDSNNSNNSADQNGEPENGTVDSSDSGEFEFKPRADNSNDAQSNGNPE